MRFAYLLIRFNSGPRCLKSFHFYRNIDTGFAIDTRKEHSDAEYYIVPDNTQAVQFISKDNKFAQAKNCVLQKKAHLKQEGIHISLETYWLSDMCIPEIFRMEATVCLQYEVKASRRIWSAFWIKFMRNRKEKTFETRVINSSPQSQESVTSRAHTRSLKSNKCSRTEAAIKT